MLGGRDPHTREGLGKRHPVVRMLGWPYPERLLGDNNGESTEPLGSEYPQLPAPTGVIQGRGTR